VPAIVNNKLQCVSFTWQNCDAQCINKYINILPASIVGGASPKKMFMFVVCICLFYVYCVSFVLKCLNFLFFVGDTCLL
jgi:hypothetical protein